MLVKIKVGTVYGPRVMYVNPECISCIRVWEYEIDIQGKTYSVANGMDELTLALEATNQHVFKPREV